MRKLHMLHTGRASVGPSSCTHSCARMRAVILSAIVGWLAAGGPAPAACSLPEPIELLDFREELQAEPPQIVLIFSAQPTIERKPDELADPQIVVLECEGVVNRATSADYARQFSEGSPIEAIYVSQKDRVGKPVLIVRSTLRSGWSARLERRDGASAARLVFVPGSESGARTPAVQPADSRLPTSSRDEEAGDDGTPWIKVTLLLVGGIALMIAGGYFGGGVRHAREWLVVRLSRRPDVAAAPADAPLVRDEPGDRPNETPTPTADAASAASERHETLVASVDEDMARLREEIRSMTGEFERATESVLLFADHHAVARGSGGSEGQDVAAVAPPGASDEDDEETTVIPRDRADGDYRSREDWISSVSDRLEAAGAEFSEDAFMDPPEADERDQADQADQEDDVDDAVPNENTERFDAARELARSGASLEDIAAETGLRRGEIELLMRIEGMRGEDDSTP